MAYVLGGEGKLYTGTAGGTAASEFVKVTKVKVNCKRATGSVITREDDIELTLFGTKQVSLDIECPMNSASAQLMAIKAAYLNNTAIALKAIDGDTGLTADGDFGIDTFDEDQPRNEAAGVTIHASPHAKGTRKVTVS